VNWAAHLIGIFYVFAGVVSLRAMAMDRLFDAAIAALSPGKVPDPNERIKSLWLTFGAALTLASGVALLILSVLAPGLFVANSAVQTGYILWSERALPPQDAAERTGRAQTINAALVYAVATVFAVLAAPEFTRSAFSIGPLPSLAVEFAIVLFATGGAYFYFIGKLRLRIGYDDDLEMDPDHDADAEIAEPSKIGKALRLEPAIGRSPVCDDITAKDVPLEALPISDALRERIRRWNDSYPTSLGSEEFIAEGEAIVAEFRKEWSDTLVSNVRREW
jgi:hypothetical protein